MKKLSHMLLTTFLLTTMIFSTYQAHSQDLNCLNENKSNTSLKNLIFNSGLTVQAQSEYLNMACEDLASPDQSRSSKGFMTFIYNFSRFTIRGGLSAIFTKLSNDGIEGQYKRELQKISKIENRWLRLRNAYELAAKFQGAYDDSLNSKPFQSGYFVFTPRAVLHNAEKKGSGGVCRHFAALLEWTLKQVSRSPNDSDMALGLNSFAVKVVASLDHVWVRVYLPYKKEDGSTVFDELDLDTTNYERAIPLLPITSKRDYKNEFYECDQLRKCI